LSSTLFIALPPWLRSCHYGYSAISFAKKNK
jgi:hypothetical protein